MVTTDQELQQRIATAVSYCREQMAWYTKYKARQWIGYLILEGMILGAGVVTPLFILLLDEKLFAVGSSSIMLVAVILKGIFQPKEHYLRFAYTSEALKEHLLKFETRTTERYDLKHSTETALNHFVEALSIITAGELNTWRAYKQ